MKERLRRALVAPLAALAIGACDNPVSEEVHTPATGVTLRLEGTSLVSVNGGTTTGSISLVQGTQSPVLTVHFLDAEGSVITPRSGYYLDVTSSNSAVAAWVPSGSGAFSGRIAASAVGTATLTFQYMHGRVGSGHPDARIGINVAVAAAP